MKFSIIVVCLNPGPKLNQTLDSILSQTYPDFEIIVKDGGSRDGSVETMREDRHIHLYQEPDHSIYEAMNQAVSHVTGDYILFLNCGDTSNLTAKWWVTSENVTENGMYGQKGILHNETIWHAFRGTIFVSVCCALLAGTIGTLVGYAVSKNRRSKWANYVNSMAFLPYLMPSLAVGAAFFILFSTEKLNLFNTYTLLIIVGTIKYIPFASRSSLNSMLQLSGEIEEAAIIQDIPWIKRMTRIIIPIQKSSIISGYLLPFMTCLRELSLFMLLCVQGFILSTTLDYFDEMGLYAFSSGINLILIITILVCNTLVNKVTGASLDKGIGG